MKKQFLITLILIFGFLVVTGQTKPKVIKLDYKRNAVYGEFLGNGLYYSINYERQFVLKDNERITVRIGLSDITLVTEFNYLIGGKNNFFETGAGYTYFFSDPDNLVLIRAGYRFQGNKGLIFRIAPLWAFNTETDSFGGFWCGFSVGYNF